MSADSPQHADHVERFLKYLRRQPVIAAFIALGLVVGGVSVFLQQVTGKAPAELFTHPASPGVDTQIVAPNSLEFVFSEPVRGLPVPSADNCYSDTFIDWAQTHGGVPANRAFGSITFTARGNGESLVRVEGIEVRKKVVPAVGSANYVDCPVGGGEDVPTASINLDAIDVGVSYSGYPDSDTSRPVFKLTAGERETMNLFVTTKRSSVLWAADLLLTVNGKRQTLSLTKGEQRIEPATTPGQYWDGHVWVAG